MTEADATNQQPVDGHLSEAEAERTIRELQEEHQFDTSMDDQDEP